MLPRIITVAALSISLVVSAQTYERKTNLPTVYINTFNNAPVTSKNVYVYAKMHYVDENDVVTAYDSVQIRGRGNSTWKLPKKPYRIKFHKKEKFLGKGHAKAKNWTLIANAGDKTLMRNAITSLMGEYASLKFNPAAKYVDLVLNDVYQGNYQISDQIEVKAHRVNIAEQEAPLADGSDITGGYLLEVDGFKDGNCFTTSRYSVPIRIHYPDEDDIASKQNAYIRNYMASFEDALASSDYTDPARGYRHWVDSVSLVNWYICTELSANIDGFYSTYFYKDKADSLIYWGPLWDYDIAYNNDSRKPGTTTALMTDYGYGQTKQWVNRMWTDPWFANLVNRRYNQLLDSGLVAYLHAKIDSISSLLDESHQLNYQKWGINKRMYNEIVLYSSYDQYVADLKYFISEHSAWLKTAFADKKPAEPTPAFVARNYYYRIKNAKTSKAIDIVDNYAVQYVNTDSKESQEWIIKPAGGYFVIINRDNGLALNDPTQGSVGPTTNLGTQLNVAIPDDEDSRQLWTLVPQGTAGYYNLLNKYTQHIANLSSGSNDDYAHIVSYSNDNRNGTSQNRLWYVTPDEEIPSAPTCIEDLEPEEYALAYNPQTHILHFGSDDPSQLRFNVVVYSAGGIKEASFTASDGYDMSMLPSGVYVVAWKVGGKQRSVKLSK